MLDRVSNCTDLVKVSSMGEQFAFAKALQEYGASRLDFLKLSGWLRYWSLDLGKHIG